MLPYIFILRINSILDPQLYSITENDSAISIWLLQMVPSALIQNIIANLLIFIQAWMINHFCAKHKLSRETTLFSGLFYIIFISLLPENNDLSPVLIANTFILIALNQLFKTYKVTDATALIFNIGFLIGLATLIYPPYWIFIFFGIISMVLMRNFKLVELLQYIIGFVLPFFFLNTYHFWYDVNVFDHSKWNFYLIKIPSYTLNLSIIFGIGLIVLSIFVSLFFHGSILSKKSIHAQKNIDVVYWLLFFCILTAFINVPNDIHHLLCPALFLSLLLGIFVSDSKKKLLFELVHIIIFIFIIITQFGFIP